MLIERNTFIRDELVLSVASFGTGRPMVFQHGLGGDAAQTADVFPQNAGWRALTLECRGHGRSEPGPPEGFSISTFAADVAAMIEAYGAAPLPVGGISMGAAIALRIASTRPDLVSALILARPAWLDAPRPDNMGPNRFVGELLRGYTKEDAREIFEKSLLAQRLAQEAPDNLVALRGFLRRDDVDVTRELLLRIPDDGPGLDRRAIASLRMPALVIGNGRDAVHPLEMARELAQLLPGAHFAEIVSKSDDRDRYREGFRTAVAAFLKDCTQ